VISVPLVPFLHARGYKCATIEINLKKNEARMYANVTSEMGAREEGSKNQRRSRLAD